MATTSEKIDHPTFGPCERVPSLIAISWKHALDPESVSSLLEEQGLSLATETPASAKETQGARDLRIAVNNSTTLSWVTGTRITAKIMTALEGNDSIAWVSPAFRAIGAEPGPQSYFTINPTVLLLTAEAAQHVGDVRSLDDAASVDQKRSQLLKGFTVINLPRGNTIETAAKIGSSGVVFENIPYISPLCGCGCSGSAADATQHRRGRCTSTPAVTPNDTFYPQQWGLQRINAPNAWAISEGDPNVVVAVLDQGVQLDHPDLNLWPLSYSTITHTNNGSPVGNHGTPCAGIISARTNNAAGVSGLAGKCRVMAISTNFADIQVAEGLYFAADNGARVVSMSFGVYPSWMIWNFAIIEAALEYCRQKNVALVAASGNENIPTSRFPGSDPRCICVGGSNRSDVRKSVGDSSIEGFWGACYGPSVDVVAPCLEIPSTDRLGAAGYTPGDYTMLFNGTSSATPHVAALAGLIVSVNPSLSSEDVRRIIAHSADKINPAGYAYLPNAGKPHGTWNNEVGYGRINAERALLIACAGTTGCDEDNPCCVDPPLPDACCVSPCDPPWRPDEQCMYWYETKYFRAPLEQRGKENENLQLAAFARAYIEFRINYQHKLCLLGKQHGALLYTITLLPGEETTLYHSDRYRRITSEQERFSVQTTFMQFLSVVHQARSTATLDSLAERLSSTKSGSAGSVGGGLAGLLGLPSGSISRESSVSDYTLLRMGFVSDQFHQSVTQASSLTQAERSLVVSTYEDKEIRDVTSRKLRNANECRAVTYFVRQVVELYAVSTTVHDISYRIVAPNAPPDWRDSNDVAWLPKTVQEQISSILRLLPKVGDVTERAKPISLPTDGSVYDPELAHCSSCEPAREATQMLALEKQKAEARQACLKTQLLELELQRRHTLLQKGELAPFEQSALPPLVEA